MKQIHLVACSGKKLAQPAPARELYQGDLFKKAAAAAAASFEPWFILSAKHGLVHPNTVLSPYDTGLRTFTKPARTTWAIRVRDQLLMEVTPPRLRVIMWAGALYCQPLAELLRSDGFTVDLPLAGEGIGKQKQIMTDVAAVVAGLDTKPERDPAEGNSWTSSGGLYRLTLRNAAQGKAHDSERLFIEARDGRDFGSGACLFGGMSSLDELIGLLEEAAS